MTLLTLSVVVNIVVGHPDKQVVKSGWAMSGKVLNWFRSYLPRRDYIVSVVEQLSANNPGNTTSFGSILEQP